MSLVDWVSVHIGKMTGNPQQPARTNEEKKIPPRCDSVLMQVVKEEPLQLSVRMEPHDIFVDSNTAETNK